MCRAFVQSAANRAPVYDLLDWLRFYCERMEANDWAGYLWTRHNEHHIVISRILLALDVRWLGGQGTAFALFGTLMLVGMAATISSIISRSGGPPGFRLTVLSIAIMLLLPTYIATTISTPAMGVFLHTAAFALFALLLLDGVAKNPRFSQLRRLSAIAAGCLAGFGVSGGLLIWPVMAWLAWRGSLEKFWIAAIIVGGACFAFIYVREVPSLRASGIGADHVQASLDYVIRFLGLPWSHMHQLLWPARALGLLVLSVGTYLVVKDFVTGPQITREQRIGLALVIFALLIALAAGLARSDFAPEREMPVRYAIFVVLAHVGFLLYFLPLLQRLWHSGAQRRIQILAIVLAGIFLGQQLITGLLLKREAARYNGAWAAFVRGEWTPEMAHYVYPNPERARNTLIYLRTHSVRWTQLWAD